MPVAPVAAPADAQRPAASPDAAPAAGGGDFASALATANAAAGGDPADLPSVRLGQMVAAFASQDAPSAPGAGLLEPDAPAEAAGVQAATAAGGPAASGAGARVLAAGEQYLGVPYKWGGTSPTSGFDCSGFVQRTFADVGVSLPRVSVDQARAGTAVPSMAEARPGDLVFWNGDGSRPNHIGIYAGEGRMLVAPRTGDVVRYQDISREPHSIRRVL